MEIFQSIYSEPLTFIDGVETCLGELKKRGVMMAILTHANEEWTWRKYGWLKLNRFFPKKMIFICSEDEHKTAESWKKVFETLKIEPKQGMVVGDSPRSDINPAVEIGVGQVIMYQGREIWEVHKQQVPESVKIIQNLREIIA